MRYQPPVHGVSFVESDEAKLRSMEEATRRHFRHSACRDICRRLSALREPPLHEAWDWMHEATHEAYEWWKDACAGAWSSWWGAQNASAAGVMGDLEADVEAAAWGS